MAMAAMMAMIATTTMSSTSVTPRWFLRRRNIMRILLLFGVKPPGPAQRRARQGDKQCSCPARKVILLQSLRPKDDGRRLGAGQGRVRRRGRDDAEGGGGYAEKGGRRKRGA